MIYQANGINIIKKNMRNKSKHKFFLKIFIQALNENNATNQFIYNIDEDDKINYIIRKIKTTPFSILTSAFTWSKTKEGVYFWNKVNDDYIQKIKDYAT